MAEGRRRLVGGLGALTAGALLAPGLRALDRRGMDAGALDPPVPPVGSATPVERPDGTVLHATVSGRGGPGYPTFVLTHGLSCDHRLWAYQARLLGELGRVVTWDLRGHGDSTAGRVPVAADLRATTLAGDLVAVVDQLTDGPVFLAGHSLGGLVTMLALREHASLRARVLGAATIAAPVHDLARAAPLAGVTEAAAVRLLFAWMAGDPRIHRWFLDERRAATRAYGVLRAGGFGARPSPAHVEALRLQIAATSPAVRRATLAGMRGVDLRGTLRHVTTPTLVFAGGRDRLVDPGHARQLAGELPFARPVVFARAGHAVVLERHAAITRRIALLAAAALDGNPDLDVAATAGCHEVPVDDSAGAVAR